MVNWKYARCVRRVAAMPLACRRLSLVGVPDLVEFHKGADGEKAYPIEYKRGKPKPHRADEAQLCAQTLCFEEMTGRPVSEGALFYRATPGRVIVHFDYALRKLTEEIAQTFHQVMNSGVTPPAPNTTGVNMSACSLLDLCRPNTNLP